MIQYFKIQNVHYPRSQTNFNKEIYSYVTVIKNKFDNEMFSTHNIISIISECETGKYGINCSKNCGNCHKQYECHHVDGFCSEGCSAGYKGSLCNECKYHFLT